MYRKYFFILFIIATLLSGCASPSTSTPSALSFTDGLNHSIKLAGPAQRIISMAPSNTEILFAIGAGKQVVGRDDLSDFPVDVKAIPSVGGMNKYNMEQIVALKPDLVLMAEINSPDQAKAIQDLGITVYYLPNPKTLDDLYANLETIARLTGHETEAAALVVSLKNRVAAVDTKVTAVTARPVVFYELDSTDPAKPYTVGPGSFVDQLILRAGGASFSSAAGIKDPYPQVSIEQVVTTNPDIIILGDSMWGVSVDSLAARPGWGSLKAVSGKNVFPFDDNLVSRPGPRLVDGLEALAKLLHPELFK